MGFGPGWSGIGRAERAGPLGPPKGIYRSLQGGEKWKIWKNRKMHKTAREKRSEFNSGARMYRKKICTTFIFFGKHVFEKIFRPRLWHLRWCQMIAQRSPKLFGKTSFLTPQTFLEHVRNMSKKCILSYHIMSYAIISYDIIACEVIPYDMIS